MVKKTSSEWYFSDIDHDILYGEGWVEEVKNITKTYDTDSDGIITHSDYWYTVPITYRKYNDLKNNSTTVNFNKNDHVEPFTKQETNSECIIL